MGEAFLKKVGGVGKLEISGQQLVAGVYQENINKYDPVYFIVSGGNKLVSKSNNLISNVEGRDGAGYALSSGVTNDTKKFVQLFS